MPLTISRREMVSTVASSDTSGMKGSKISHSASVRSEGYAFRSLISSSPFLGFLHMLLLSFIGLGTWFLHFLRHVCYPFERCPHRQPLKRIAPCCQHQQSTQQVPY